MSNLQSLWTLIRLRYLLQWAQARTRKGRFALLLVTQVLGATVVAMVGFGGVEVALAIVRQGQVERLLRWGLSGLFINGLVFGLVFGIGSRKAFSNEVLRRYPISRYFRMAARHLLALLDPVWLLLFSSALGLALGISTAGLARLYIGLPALILYILICYLTAASIISLVDHLLRNARALALASGFVFVIITLVFAAIPMLERELGIRLLLFADRLLCALPPGIVATLLAGGDSGDASIRWVVLLCWGATLGYILSALESLPRFARVSKVNRIHWSNSYKWLALLFGSDLAPLVEKSLRYHLRCNRVRLNCLMAILMVVLLPRIMGGRGGPKEIFLAGLAFFFISSLAATSAISLNQFGYDGEGIRRYLTWPMPIVSALRAGSIASLLLDECVILGAWILWFFIPGLDMQARMAVMLLASGLAGGFFLNAVGLWTSILAPRRCDFGSLLRNEMSSAGFTVVAGGMLLALVPAFLLVEAANMEEILDCWWVVPALTCVSAGGYLLSWYLVANPAATRREWLIQIIP